jgi:hypothetical protein
MTVAPGAPGAIGTGTDIGRATLRWASWPRSYPPRPNGAWSIWRPPSPGKRIGSQRWPASPAPHGRPAGPCARGRPRLEDDRLRDRLVTALAPWLAPATLPRAMVAARALRDEDEQTQALAALARQLPPAASPISPGRVLARAASIAAAEARAEDLIPSCRLATSTAARPRLGLPRDGPRRLRRPAPQPVARPRDGPRRLRRPAPQPVARPRVGHDPAGRARSRARRHPRAAQRRRARRGAGTHRSCGSRRAGVPACSAAFSAATARPSRATGSAPSCRSRPP